jgi:hypothetical protein
MFPINRLILLAIRLLYLRMILRGFVKMSSSRPLDLKVKMSSKLIAMKHRRTISRCPHWSGGCKMCNGDDGHSSHTGQLKFFRFPRWAISQSESSQEGVGRLLGIKRRWRQLP